MTGCRKQLPEVESRKEKVRGWGDGELPFPPLPNLSLVPVAVALPCPCIWLLPQRVCGQQGLDASLAPGCPGCSIPVPSPYGTARDRLGKGFGSSRSLEPWGCPRSGFSGHLGPHLTPGVGTRGVSVTLGMAGTKVCPATEQSTQRQCNGDPAEPTGHPLLGTPQGDAGTWWLGPWVPL